jgi:hypothetical protein
VPVSYRDFAVGLLDDFGRFPDGQFPGLNVGGGERVLGSVQLRGYGWVAFDGDCVG